jgi:Zn-dependent metalloprotease
MCCASSFGFLFLSLVATVAHEFSHGVTHFTSGLVYSYESGALNEAFSDIMAAAAERLIKSKPAFPVWYFGEDLDLLFGRGIRNMAYPPEFDQPDHFADRAKGAGDNGGVHINRDREQRLLLDGSGWNASHVGDLRSTSEL